MAKLKESDIRRGLESVEQEIKQTFVKAGVSESEAAARAEKVVRRRGIGERVERQHQHDPAKEKAAEGNRAEHARVQRERDERRENARIDEIRKKTGRKFFT